ncbi:uncharacterized protein VK521_017560 [Ammospiza maritima maritima]
MSTPRSGPWGVVRVSGRTLGLEAALDVAAVAGAEDVTQDGTEIQFLCAPSALGSVRRGLVAAGLRPLAAAVEFRPRSALALPDGPRAAAERLLRALARACRTSAPSSTTSRTCRRSLRPEPRSLPAVTRLRTRRTAGNKVRSVGRLGPSVVTQGGQWSLTMVSGHSQWSMVTQGGQWVTHNDLTTN